MQPQEDIGQTIRNQFLWDIRKLFNENKIIHDLLDQFVEEKWDTPEVKDLVIHLLLQENLAFREITNLLFKYLPPECTKIVKRETSLIAKRKETEWTRQQKLIGRGGKQ